MALALTVFVNLLYFQKPAGSLFTKIFPVLGSDRVFNRPIRKGFGGWICKGAFYLIQAFNDMVIVTPP